jgi:hypothetical protein
MEPPALFMYDTAGLTAHYMRSRVVPRLPAVLKAPAGLPEDPQREARQQWEEEGGN